eukprot:1722916-Rhodomonas_salina.6
MIHRRILITSRVRVALYVPDLLSKSQPRADNAQDLAVSAEQSSSSLPPLFFPLRPVHPCRGRLVRCILWDCAGS